MAAIIRSFRNGITPITGLSRGDLESTDIVLLTAVDAHTTYSWVIAFAPAGSAATFSGVASASSPGSFTVDVEGSYLIKLTVDAGLGTEDEQFVRLRALTSFGELRLVAAGERRDSGGVIPVDVDVEGWANDQNFNLVRLNNFVKSLVSSGRLLYVDANDGTDNYGDQALVQAAIDQADTAGASEAEQWVIAVRPGVYVEDLTFKPWVHVLGWPGNPDGLTSKAVILRTATATGHVAAITNASDRVLVSDLHLEAVGVTANATIRKTGLGHIHLHRCRVEQNGISAGQGAAFDLQSGVAHITSSGIQHTDSGASDRVALTQTGATTTLFVQDSNVIGPSALSLNPSLVVDQAAEFLRSRIKGSDGAGAGFTSSAQSVLVNACVIDVPVGAAASAVLIHPSGGALVGNMDVTLKYSTVNGDISYETTGIAGTEDLNISALEYRALTFPGPAPTQSALVKSKSHFYDNTIIGALAAEDVQDALDELASVIVPDDDHQFEVAVSPGNTIEHSFLAPYDLTVVAIKVRVGIAAVTAGVYTLAIEDADLSNNLLGAATEDLEALASNSLNILTLTGTVANLDLATGTRVTFTLASDNADLTGSGFYVQMIYRSQ